MFHVLATANLVYVLTVGVLFDGVLWMTGRARVYRVR